MLKNLEILMAGADEIAEPVRRAIWFAVKLAADQEASISASDFHGFANPFYHISSVEKVKASPVAWAEAAAEHTHRIVVLAGDPKTNDRTKLPPDISAVHVACESWQSEATLFAGSALANLLGDPEREPLVPAAHYAAHCIGYAIYCAISSIHAGWRRHGQQEQSDINAQAVLGWVNWKAAAAGAMGRDIQREGDQAEWPVLPCKDGNIAFVYTERDWDAIRAMIGDTRLDDERFSTFKGRAKNRDAYMNVVRDWIKDRTKSELNAAFQKSGIPGAAVATIADLLEDPLLAHRGLFVDGRGQTKIPKAPHQVARQAEGVATAKIRSDESNRPLAGIKILDLGIITAGAGVGALLADLGAEVLKIESETYPDPFRMWAGSSDGDSPLFKFNNRNKKGIALDLKTPEGHAQFLKLAADADMVIENFRRGVLDRLGLTFDALRDANPNILLVSISGQGLTGPGADHTTFGSTLEASSGFASLTHYDDKVPVISGRNLNYPDQIVCLYGAAIAAAAVAECTCNGKAMHLDVSQRDCAVYQAGNIVAEVSHRMRDDPTNVGQTAVSEGLDRFFKTAGGDYIALTAQDRSALSSLKGLQETSDEAIAEWASKQTAEEISKAFESSGLGAQKNLSGSEMFALPSIRSAGAFAKSPGGDLVKGFPFRLSNAALSIHCDSPKVGEHTDEYVLA